jgi:hypothetical protein
MKKITQSSRAGLLFPVGRIRRKFKNMPIKIKRLGKLSSVYTTAVLEYLTGS